MSWPTIHVICLPERKHLIEKEFSDYGITNYRLWPAIKDLMIPFRGISMAHKQIVRWAQQQQLPEILIAEDDMVFTAKGAFEYFLEKKPADYDLYLSSVYNGAIAADGTCERFRGLTLYFISAKFYEILLATPEKQNIDAALEKLGKFIVCQPFIAIQRDGYSYHKKKICKYSSNMLHRSLFGWKSYGEYAKFHKL